MDETLKEACPKAPSAGAPLMAEASSGLPREFGAILDTLLVRPPDAPGNELVELIRLFGAVSDRFDELAREIREMRAAAVRLIESRPSGTIPGTASIRTATGDSERRISCRERQILTGLLGGKSNREISAALGISEKTVKNHLWKIYRKIGVRSRTQLFHHIICP